jgi:methionine sulfoxide reductase heme-binding subunit
MKYPWLRFMIHAAGLLPLAWMVGDFLLHWESYSANRALMLRSGSVGLILLVAAFAVSPLAWWLRQPVLVQPRRALGLYGFLFVCIHLLVYAWLDNAFMLDLMVRDLGERRAMSVGLLAFALLIPLAITSTTGWQRRLGKRWRALHRLVYLALPLSVLHYLWLERDFITKPMLFAGIVGVLLLMRLSWLRQQIKRYH